MSRVLPFLVLAACAAPDPRVRLEPPPPEVGWVEAAIEPAVATLVREPLATGVRSAVALRGDRVMIEREDGTWIVDAFGDLTPVPFVTGELHDSAIRYHEDSTLWPDGTDLVATEAAGVLRVDPTDTVRRARELDGVARIRDVDCPHGWLCMVETGSETYQIELAPYLEEFPQRLNGGPVTHAVRQHDGGTRASARGDLLSYQGFTTRVVRLPAPVVQLVPDLALTPEGLYTLEDYSLPRRTGIGARDGFSHAGGDLAVVHTTDDRVLWRDWDRTWFAAPLAPDLEIVGTNGEDTILGLQGGTLWRMSPWVWVDVRVVGSTVEIGLCDRESVVHLGVTVIRPDVQLPLEVDMESLTATMPRPFPGSLIIVDALWENGWGTSGFVVLPASGD